MRWKAHVKINAKSLVQNTRKCNGSWQEDRPCRYTINSGCTNKYLSLCGPAAHSCGDAGNRARLTSFNEVKTRYLGVSLMHFGVSQTPNSARTFKWRWLRMKRESSLRSIKKGFTTLTTSKRSSCSTAVNWCDGLQGETNPFELLK